jgi:hypothetical protein
MGKTGKVQNILRVKSRKPRELKLIGVITVLAAIRLLKMLHASNP